MTMKLLVYAAYFNDNASDHMYKIIGPAEGSHWELAQKVLGWATGSDQQLVMFDPDPSRLRQLLVEEDKVDPDDIAPDIVDIYNLK